VRSDPPTPPNEIEPQYNPATHEAAESPTDESDNFPFQKNPTPIYNSATQEFAKDDEAD
jgi:hypothetical protein